MAAFDAGDPLRLRPAHVPPQRCSSAERVVGVAPRVALTSRRPGAFRYGLKRPGMQETFCARRLIATTPYRQKVEAGEGMDLVRTSTKHLYRHRLTLNAVGIITFI